MLCFAQLCVCVCSVPVISDEVARESLVLYCDKKCCYGTGAARTMIIGKMESTSAFHVCS